MRRTSPLMRGPNHPLTCDGLPGGPGDALTSGVCSHTGPSLLTRSAQAWAPIPGLPGHAHAARTAGGPPAAGGMDRRT
jgi:hypothetical protein